MEREDAVFTCEKCGKKYASKADMYRCMAEDLDKETAARVEEDEKFTEWFNQLKTIRDEINAFNKKLVDNRGIYFRANLIDNNKRVVLNSQFAKSNTVCEKDSVHKEQCSQRCKCKSTKKDPFTFNFLNFSDADRDKLIEGVKSAKTWKELGLFDDIKNLVGENLSEEELTEAFNEAMKDPEISKLADSLQKKNEDNEWQEFFINWLKEGGII